MRNVEISIQTNAVDVVRDFQLSKANGTFGSFSREFFLPSLQKNDERQAQQNLSLIDDPLWKDIYSHILDSMGAESALTIWNCSLGEVSSTNQQVDIHCHTEEAAEFLHQYSFVIVGCLRKYFPSVAGIDIHLDEDC